MGYSSKLKLFIQKNKSLIDNEDWDDLFLRWGDLIFGLRYDWIPDPGRLQGGELLFLLLKLNINPIPKMTIIPNYMFEGWPIEGVSLPGNIKIIGAKAFANSSIKSLHISHYTIYSDDGEGGIEVVRY